MVSIWITIGSSILCAIIALIISYFLPKEKIRTANQSLIEEEQEKQLAIANLEKDYLEKEKQLEQELNNKLNSLQSENDQLQAQKQELLTNIETAKSNWETEKAKASLELTQQTKDLEIKVHQLEEKRNNIIQTLEQEAKESGQVFKKQQLEIAEQQIEVAKKEMEEQYEVAIEQAKSTYLDVLADLVNDINEKYSVSAKELEEALSKLAEAQAKASAAIEVNKRAEMEKTQKDFYRLQLSDIDLEEIQRLRSVEPYLRNKEPLNKVIYKCYYEKPYTALVGRVVGGKRKTGIYKITNLENGMVYVGQSLDIAERWRQHIKRGVGADTPTQNKLYPAMLEYGVENFMFEIIEECLPAELTAREKYWTDFYGAQTYGYVVKKG